MTKDSQILFFFWKFVPFARLANQTNFVNAGVAHAIRQCAGPPARPIVVVMTAAAEAAREMALAELLGEVDRGASDTRVSSENGHRNAHAGPSFDLHLGALAITTGAGDADEAAFARLLGVGAGDDEGSLDVQLVKYADHDVVRNVMRACGSADLHEKARVVTARLKAVELESIQEYVAESANLTQLHDQINVCDTVLGSMELLLKEFKDDLGKIGGEIKDLQTQSNGMSVKLSNRKLANAILGDFVREISVDETLIKHIVEDQVSEEYMKHMVKVDRKLRFVKNDPRVAARLGRFPITTFRLCDYPYSSCEGSVTTRRAHSRRTVPRLLTYYQSRIYTRSNRLTRSCSSYQRGWRGDFTRTRSASG